MLQDPKETTQPDAVPAQPPPGAPRRGKLRLGDLLVQQGMVTEEPVALPLAGSQHR
jgi:hypothetical protein